MPKLSQRRLALGRRRVPESAHRDDIGHCTRCGRWQRRRHAYAEDFGPDDRVHWCATGNCSATWDDEVHLEVAAEHSASPDCRCAVCVSPTPSTSPQWVTQQTRGSAAFPRGSGTGHGSDGEDCTAQVCTRRWTARARAEGLYGRSASLRVEARIIAGSREPIAMLPMARSCFVLEAGGCTDPPTTTPSHPRTRARLPS